MAEDSSFPAILDVMHIKNYGLIGIAAAQSQSLAGVISDGDLRRAIAKHQEKVFSLKAVDIMTREPKTISADALAVEAVAMMEKHKNTVLLVDDSKNENKSISIIHMHDLVEAKLI